MKLSRTLMLGSALIALVASSAIAANTPQPLKIHMNALNKSGESGFATITDLPDGLHVLVQIKGAPAGVEQPTHIHVGNCGNINKAPEYPLSNTVDGHGVSLVKGVHLAQLTSAHYAINVHKSTDDIADYVSCGNIK